MLNVNDHHWALLLAGNDDVAHESSPTKRHHRQSAQQHLATLHTTFERAHAVVRRERICAVVTAQPNEPQAHLQLPPENYFVQPCNRGTGMEILLPLLHLAFRDPDARVVILPTHQHVQAEAILRNEIRHVLQRLKSRHGIVLLGMEPDAAASQHNFIVRGSVDNRLCRIDCFVDRPSPQQAAQLASNGSLWNSRIVVATASALIDLFTLRVPEIVEDMQVTVIHDELRPNRPFAANYIYRMLPHVDFQQDILRGAEDLLRLLPVPACGWRDLREQEHCETMPAQPQQLSIASDTSLTVSI